MQCASPSSLGAAGSTWSSPWGPRWGSLKDPRVGAAGARLAKEEWCCCGGLGCVGGELGISRLVFKRWLRIYTFGLVWQQKNVHFLWITWVLKGKSGGDVAFFLSLKEHQGTLCRSKLLAQRTGRGLLWTVLLMKCESNFHLIGKGPAGLRGQKILQNFAFHGC